MKLTRSQIKEALTQTPIDKLMLGENAKDISLTHKQKLFAEEIAKGATKAKAYRTAYDSKGSPHTQSQEGQKLMKNPTIAHHVETIRLAIEAQKYLFPTHLRALVIQQLTEKALDPSVNHAQQIKALELIGKFSDVALFNERKEVKTDTNTQDAKAKLLETLTNAITTSKTIDQDDRRKASDLLQEIAKSISNKPQPLTIDAQLLDEATPQENDTDETPTECHPQKNLDVTGQHMHTIPHEPPPSETTPIVSNTKEGEGVSNFWEQFEEVPMENTPLSDSGSPTNPVDEYIIQKSID